MSSLILIATLALAFWLGLALDRRRAWPGEAFLPQDAEKTDSVEPPAVTAVVPARDEAEVLPETLPALLEQDLPGFRVVVADDGSADGTAEVARKLAREIGAEDRLRIVRVPPTPRGWTGKVHALAQGLTAVEAWRKPPEWLLFTDADIRHRPGSVEALLAQAAQGYDLVSVMARLSAKTFWERLLIPPFVFFFQLLYPFRQVRDPGSPVAAAAGGCILVRRTVLEAAGGVGAIRGAVIDDVSLGKAVKRAGGRLWLGFDPEIVSVRPYRSLGDLWSMVRRSAFVQLRYRWSLLIVVLLALVMLVASPPFLLGIALGWGAPWAALAAAAAWGLEAASLWPSVRHHRVPGIYAFTLPFASIFYGLMTWTSAIDHLRGRGSRWKGRSYGAPEA